MTDEKEPEIVSTFSSRIGSMREEVRKKKDNERKDQLLKKASLNDAEASFAKHTISLMSSEAFKHYQAFEADKLVISYRDAWKKNPLCERDDALYATGFNEGFNKALTYLKNERERMWRSYLFMLEQEEKVKNENEKSNQS